MIFTVDWFRYGELVASASGEVMQEGDLIGIALDSRKQLAAKFPDWTIFEPGLEQRVRHSLTPATFQTEVKP